MVNANKMVDGHLVKMTDTEQAEVKAITTLWDKESPARRMVDLRRQRAKLLAETDHMGNSDVVMSEDWATYRQALRDITTQTPADDALSNITFPTKPTE